jgi:DHA1 family tetracycline resistance protein-like MFS transporter
MSSYGLMQFVFAPILGRLSDRYGRRPILLLSLLFSCFDYIIMALAPSVGFLFIGRVLSGITGASFTAASAYIADVSPPEKRAQNFGMIGAAFGIGFIIGPAAGGLLGHFGLRTPFWASAVLCLVNALYGLFVLPESLSVEKRKPFAFAETNPLNGLSILTRFGWVRMLSLSIALFSLAQIIMQATWVLFTTYRYHWTVWQNGLVLALVGLLTGVIQVVGTKRFVDWLGEKRTVLLGQLICAFGFLGFSLASKGWMTLVVLPFESLGGIAGPATQSLVSRQYGDDEQGAVQGALTSLQSLMGVVAPLLGTYIFALFTAPNARFHFAGAPLFVAALLIFGAAYLAYIALRPQPNSVRQLPHA